MKKFTLEQVNVRTLISGYRLSIPQFQRAYVWSNEKKQKLFDSLEQNFPIGAITLFQDTEKECYYIIDGLQRINTLTELSMIPSNIVSTKKYISRLKIEDYFVKYNQISHQKTLKNIKRWYKELNRIFQYSSIANLSKYINDDNCFTIEMLEELLYILIEPINFEDQEIPIIIYKGNLDDIPDLFHNINTTSLPLSKYEIYHAIWNEYKLDNNLFDEYYPYYKLQLECDKKTYQITAEILDTDFDIFKNLVALNNKISSINDANILFRLWSKLQEPINYNGIIKFYNEEEISFELYSIFLSQSTSKITNSIKKIFNDRSDISKINKFILSLNNIIIEEVMYVIKFLNTYNIKGDNQHFNKYHSFYVLNGFVLSKYDIDVDTLKIVKYNNQNQEILEECMQINEHIDSEWFYNENRQVTFLKNKLMEQKMKASMYTD